MTVRTATNVMRRKAGEGRPAPEIGRMTTARAWKLAMPRAAQDTVGLQASVLRVEETRVVSSDLPGLVPEHALIALVEGPEERFGIAFIDAPTLAGLIEATTTGRVASRVPAPREPTRTDAIIAADLLDALLEGFDIGLSEMDEPPNLAGYRFAAPLAEARAIELTLAEGPYSAFRLTVDLGGGVRQGDMTFAFPLAERGAARGRDVATFQKALAENVMGAPTELEVSLFRLNLPLSELSQLVAGDVLKVPLSALAAVELVAGGMPVATARLGQQSGFRAVRIASLAGGGADEPGGEFEEATPAPALAALPRADLRPGNDMDEGFAGPGDLRMPAADGPSKGLLPPDTTNSGLPDLGNLSPDVDTEPPEPADLPPLSGDDDED